MAGTSTFSIIAESLASAIEPLEVALRSPELFESFMLRLGWTTGTYIESVQNLGGIATNLSQLVRDGFDPGDTVPAIGQLVKFFDEVQNLSSTTGLPATIDAAEFRSDFPQQLTDYLVANYLLTQRPLLGAMLLAGGVITRTQQAAAGKRPTYERLDVAWGAVGNLVHDALSTLRNAYGWGTPAFAQQSFVDNMVTLGEALGCTVFSHSIGAQLKDILNQGATSTTSLQDGNVRWRIVGTSLSPASLECGIDLFVLPPTATAHAGIAVSPYAQGFDAAAFDITDSLSIDLKAGFDISTGVLVSIRPGQDVTVRSDLLSTNPATAGEFAATLQLRGDAGAKATLLGSESGSRFEYSSLGLTVGARTDQNGPSFYAEAAVIDGQIVISPGADADGFIAAVLPSDITVDAGLTVGVDSRRGAYFGGSAGLEIEIPTHSRLGPLEIVSAAVSVKPKGGALPVALGATFRGSLGPLAAEVDNVGLIVDLSFPGKGGNIGPVNATLKYKPPDGVGLAIDAPVVVGGGYLLFDPQNEEYAGILQLEIADTISVKAVGLLTTRMPDGSKGFALVVIITAEDFPPIQLGFGFTLTGIGGLLGINRTVMVDVAAEWPQERHAGLDPVSRGSDPQCAADHQRSARHLPSRRGPLRLRPHGDHRVGHAHHPVARDRADPGTARSGALDHPGPTPGRSPSCRPRPHPRADGCHRGDRFQQERSLARRHALRFADPGVRPHRRHGPARELGPPAHVRAGHRRLQSAVPGAVGLPAARAPGAQPRGQRQPAPAVRVLSRADVQHRAVRGALRVRAIPPPGSRWRGCWPSMRCSSSPRSSSSSMSARWSRSSAEAPSSWACSST